MKKINKDDLTVPQFRRLREIHAMIEAGRHPNCPQLSEILECTPMTIHRDINVLKYEFNAPIEYVRSEGGYVYTKPFTLPLLETIHEKEIDILAAAKILLSHYKNTPMYDSILNLIDSICGISKRGSPDNLIDRIDVAPIPLININNDNWERIKIAMSEGRKVTFTYNNSSWDPDITERTVRPYQLVLDEGKCFLFGYLEEKKDVRLFKLNKISKLVIIKDKFQLPEIYQFHKLCGGCKFGAFTRYTPKKYKIAFYEDARDEIRNGYWAEDQEFLEDEEKNCTIITFTSSQDMRVLDWVFVNKAYAVPLEPPEFVEKWRYNVKVMAQEAELLPHEPW